MNRYEYLTDNQIVELKVDYDELATFDEQRPLGATREYMFYIGMYKVFPKMLAEIRHRRSNDLTREQFEALNDLRAHLEVSGISSSNPRAAMAALAKVLADE